VQTNKNLPYYLISFGILVLLKFGYTFANNNDLIFLLKPTDKILGLLMGSQSVYQSESGFLHENLNIIINKSCSGFNFLVLSFLLFTYLTVKHLKNHLQKLLSFPIALIGAYLLTIFVNTSRIFTSIVVQNQNKSFFLNQQHLVHEAIGVITNLSFLILAYLLIDNLLTNKRNNAKFA
jgi:exosortase K